MESVTRTPVHPVQLYEALLYFVLFGVGFFWLRTSSFAKTPGRILGIILSAIFTGRCLLEWFKAPQSAFELLGFSMGQFLSVPFILVGLYFALRPSK